MGPPNIDCIPAGADCMKIQSIRSWLLPGVGVVVGLGVGPRAGFVDGNGVGDGVGAEIGLGVGNVVGLSVGDNV